MALPQDKRNTNGRPKGAVNKKPQDLIDTVMHSFNAVGGSRYLQKMAVEEPCAYLGLLGKILPKNIQLRTDSQTTLTICDSRDWLNNQILTLAKQETVIDGERVPVLIESTPGRENVTQLHEQPAEITASHVDHGLQEECEIVDWAEVKSALSPHDEALVTTLSGNQVETPVNSDFEPSKI